MKDTELRLDVRDGIDTSPGDLSGPLAVLEDTKPRSTNERLLVTGEGRLGSWKMWTEKGYFEGTSRSVSWVPRGKVEPT